MREKPVTIYSLALKNLFNRPFRTFSLVFVIAIFAATLFGGAIFTHNLSNGIKGMAERLGADILIVPYGYEKELEVALLRGEPSSFYLKADLVNKLADVPGITIASPQLFLASLSAGCCTSKVQLIGYDPQTDFVIKPWMQQKLHRALVGNEIVVGAKITANVGEEVTFFNQPFKIVAKMDSTGMGFDTSVFMTLETAHQLMQQAELVSGDKDSLKDYISSIFIRVSPDAEPKQVVNTIMQRYAVEYNLDFVMTKGMLTNIHQWLNNFSYLVYGLSALFWLLALIVITLVFSSSINERKREMSLLRILGASRQMLIKMVLSEALLICLVGALCGIAFASIIIFSFGALICQSIGLPCDTLDITSTLFNLFTVLGLTAVIGPLASIYTILTMTKFDTYSTLRAGE